MCVYAEARTYIVHVLSLVASNDQRKFHFNWALHGSLSRFGTGQYAPLPLCSLTKTKKQYTYQMIIASEVLVLMLVEERRLHQFKIANNQAHDEQSIEKKLHVIRTKHILIHRITTKASARLKQLRFAIYTHLDTYIYWDIKTCNCNTDACLYSDQRVKFPTWFESILSLFHPSHTKSFTFVSYTTKEITLNYW